MSKRSRRARAEVDPDASEDFFISASDALRNGRASSTPVGTGQSVSIEEATADRRRIHRETVPVPTPTAAPATAADANNFSADSLPYTLQSIPAWDTFFQPQEPCQEQEDASAVLEEHARRYLNSVSMGELVHENHHLLHSLYKTNRYMTCAILQNEPVV